MKIGYKYYLNKIHSKQDRSNFIYQMQAIKSLRLSNKIKDEFHFLLKCKSLNNLEKFITLISNLEIITYCKPICKMVNM